MKNKKNIAMAMAAVSTMGAVAPVFACTQEEIEKGAHIVDLDKANNRTFKAYTVAQYEAKPEEFKNENPVVALTKGLFNTDIYIVKESANDPSGAKEELEKLKERETEIKSDLEKTYTVGTKELPVYTMIQEEVERKAKVGNSYYVTVVDYVVTLKANIDEYDGETITDKTFTFKGLRFANTGIGFDHELAVKNATFKFGKHAASGNNVYVNDYRKLNQVIFELNEAKSNGKIIIVKNEENDSVELNVSLMDGTRVAKITINNISQIIKDQIKVIPLTNDFNNHWAKDTIVNSMLDGIVDVADEYRPEDSITRAEFAKIMVNTFDIEYNNHMVENFTDVKASDWHYKYIVALANKEVKGKDGKLVPVLEGNGDGTFRPDAPITRQEAAKMIATLLGEGETYTVDTYGNRVHTTVDTTHIFADGKEIAEWADESVKNLNGIKVGDTSIITGYQENGKTYFKPANNITRAEALVMIDRANQAN